MATPWWTRAADYRARQVTFPDAGYAMALLEDASFAIPAGGVTTVAQRRPFTRETLEGFLRTQADQTRVRLDVLCQRPG